jgi:hypothetical protein
LLAGNLIDNGYKNLFLSTPTPKDIATSSPPLGMGHLAGRLLRGALPYGTYDNTAIADMRINKKLPFQRCGPNTLSLRSSMAERWWKSEQGISQDSINAKIERTHSSFTRSGAWQREVSRWRQAPPSAPPLTNRTLEQCYAVRLQQLDDYFMPLVLGICGVQVSTSWDELIWTSDGRLIARTGQKMPTAVYIINKAGRAMSRWPPQRPVSAAPGPSLPAIPPHGEGWAASLSSSIQTFGLPSSTPPEDRPATR